MFFLQTAYMIAKTVAQHSQLLTAEERDWITTAYCGLQESFWLNYT